MRARSVLFIVTAAGVFAAAAPQPVLAGTSSTCTVGMTNVNFGSSVDVLPGTVVDTTATLTVSCTGGSPPGRTTRACVSIGVGSSGDATSRIMTGPGGATLRYDLYSDAAHTTLWGSWQTGYDSAGVTVDVASNSNSTVTVYARLSASQSTAVAGAYSSTFSANPFVTYNYDPGSSTCPSGTPTTSTSFTVSATVISNCNVSVATLDFGTAGVLTANKDGTTTLNAKCTNGLPYTVSLDGGSANATDPTQRKMFKSAETITYGLYRDAAYTLPWGSTINTNTASGTGSGLQQSFTVYGRVPAQTTPSPGFFSDTIVATVTY
jgi:spore coat protein U-like protein